MILFIVSTSGQGNFPLNAKKMWLQLASLNPNDCSLSFLQYAIFGLGDSEFWKPPFGNAMNEQEY